MAEDFGIQGRGAFYDGTGAMRDVVRNHLFQVLSNLTMEPPVRPDSHELVALVALQTAFTGGRTRVADATIGGPDLSES
jgi:glucose-6-phosphate 1-dehydrogenase